MTQMLFLFAIFIILFFVSLKTSYKGMILSPQVGVMIGFLLSVGYGLYWVDEYGIDLSRKTMFILILGCSLFVLCCSLFQAFMGVFGIGKTRIRDDSFSSSIINKVSYIESWKLLTFGVFQVLVLGWLVLFLIQMSGDGKLSNAIYAFRHANTFTEDKINLPSILNLLRRISIASGYYWGYFFIYSFIRKGRTNKILLAGNLCLSIINNIILGARTGAFIIIIAMVVFAYILTFINKKRKIRVKTIIIGIVAFIIISFSFKFFGSVLGRDIQFDFAEYIAIYLSAEIKNLDTYVRNNIGGGVTLYNCQTLIYVVNWFSGRFGLPNWAHELDIPFFYYKGHNLGNVSTMFYAFYYDDGIRGIIIYTIIMALLSSYVFVKAINDSKRNSNHFSFSLILYSYMYFCFLFSFFSNKFYEHIFNPSIIWFFICWKLLDYFSSKVKLSINLINGLNKNSCSDIK